MSAKAIFNRYWQIIFSNKSNEKILELDSIDYSLLRWSLTSQAGGDMSLNIFARIRIENLNSSQINIIKNQNEYLQITVFAGYVSAGVKKIYNGTVVSANSLISGSAGTEYTTEFTCIDYSPDFIESTQSKTNYILTLPKGSYLEQLRNLINHYKDKVSQDDGTFSYVISDKSIKSNPNISILKFPSYTFKATNSFSSTLNEFGKYTKTIVRYDSTSKNLDLNFYPKNMTREQRVNFLQVEDDNFFLNIDSGMLGYPKFDTLSSLMTVTSNILSSINIGDTIMVDTSNVAISNLDNFFNKPRQVKQVDKIPVHVYTLYYNLDSQGNSWNQTIKGFSNYGLKNV